MYNKPCLAFNGIYKDVSRVYEFGDPKSGPFLIALGSTCI